VLAVRAYACREIPTLSIEQEVTMKNIVRRRTLAIATLALTLLQACGGGGGGGSGSSAAGAEGAWEGTASSNGTALDLSLVVLSNGHYYGVYSQDGAAYGLLEGNGSASGSTFTSSNGRDFPFGSGAYVPFTLSAGFTPKTSINGTAQYSGFAATFTATYDAGYEVPASLTAVAGVYSGSAGSLLGVSDVGITINSSGAITATDTSGCQLSGTLTPRNGTTATFNLTVRYDQATCGTDITVSGIAGQSGTNGIVFAATRADRSNAFFGVATKL